MWIIHHIQVIGEATAGFSRDLRERHTDIPWTDVVAMRNVLVHQYFGIDLEEVWNTVQDDLPRLKGKIEVILKELEEKS